MCEGDGEVWRCLELLRELRRDPAANLLLRYDARARPHHASDCLVWPSHDDEGYARIWWQGRNWHLTRALLTALGVNLRRLDEVHHTCGNHWCVNHEHLRPMFYRWHRALHRELRAEARELEAAAD